MTRPVLGLIIQRCEEDSDSFLDENIWIEPFRDGWTVEWGYSTSMIWKIENPKTETDLVKLILRELRNGRTTRASFCSEILELDKRIVAELVARELGG